jgi:hypothetical protein
MLNHLKKGALVCAVLPLGLFVCGCSGMGHEGFEAAKANDWQTARTDFTEDYSKNPQHPIAVFNMADTYHHYGDVQQADAKFSDAVSIGKKYQPDDFLEPDSKDSTIAAMACRHLHEDHQLDPGCGDQIALITPPGPAPAPVAQLQPEPEPAPAVEAQATAPEPAKQDRN